MIEAPGGGRSCPFPARPRRRSGEAPLRRSLFNPKARRTANVCFGKAVIQTHSGVVPAVYAGRVAAGMGGRAWEGLRASHNAFAARTGSKASTQRSTRFGPRLTKDVTAKLGEVPQRDGAGEERCSRQSPPRLGADHDASAVPDPLLWVPTAGTWGDSAKQQHAPAECCVDRRRSQAIRRWR
jgi:hypothetical protein